MDKPIRGLTTRLTWPLTLALDETNTKPADVSPYRWFGGILHELLEGADGAPLRGADGYYLYGVAR